MEGSQATSSAASNPPPKPQRHRRKKPGKPEKAPLPEGPAADTPNPLPLSRAKNPRNRRPPKDTQSQDFVVPNNADNNGASSSTGKPSTRPQNNRQPRRAKFGANLSNDHESNSPVSSQSNSGYGRIHSAFTGDDLVSTLSRGLSTPPFTDCPICFSGIHPAQPTWSCSPSIPVVLPEGSSFAEAQYCWTTFHLKCIRSWSEKSYNDVKAAWRARGEPERDGEWRCPVRLLDCILSKSMLTSICQGCQGKRHTLIGGYRQALLFCNYRRFSTTF